MKNKDDWRMLLTVLSKCSEYDMLLNIYSQQIYYTIQTKLNIA